MSHVTASSVCSSASAVEVTLSPEHCSRREKIWYHGLAMYMSESNSCLFSRISFISPLLSTHSFIIRWRAAELQVISVLKQIATSGGSGRKKSKSMPQVLNVCLFPFVHGGKPVWLHSGYFGTAPLCLGAFQSLIKWCSKPLLGQTSQGNHAGKREFQSISCWWVYSPWAGFWLKKSMQKMLETVILWIAHLFKCLNCTSCLLGSGIESLSHF